MRGFVSNVGDIDSTVWLSKLRELESYLKDFISRELRFPRGVESLSKRVLGASEVILTFEDKVEVVVLRGNWGMMFVKASRKGGMDLTSTGLKGFQPSFYVARVGPYGMKCSCEDSVMTSSKAEKALLTLFRRHDPEMLYKLYNTFVTAKYVICKHTLALTSLLLALGVLDLSNEVFRKTLRNSALTLALREGLSQISEDTFFKVNEMVREAMPY